MYQVLAEDQSLYSSKTVRRVVDYDGTKYVAVLYEGQPKQIYFWYNPNFDELLKVAKKEFPDVPFSKLRAETIDISVEWDGEVGHRVSLRPKVLVAAK